MNGLTGKWSIIRISKLVVQKKYLFLGLLLIFIPVFLYHPALKYYFFQDDFYTLYKSQAGSWGDFLNFFSFGEEIYYRPLSMRLYFWLMSEVLGFGALEFHAVSLLVHIVNGFLVWKLAKIILKDNLMSWLVGFLYVTSSIHFINIYWISEIGLLFGVMLYLAASISFSNYVLTEMKAWKYATVAWFVLGILIHEYMVTFPAVMVLLGWFLNRGRNIKFIFSKFIGLGLVILAIDLGYLATRLLLFPVKATGSYVVEVSRETLRALWWYGVWSLNILENIKDQLEPGLKLRGEFIRGFPVESAATIAALVLGVLFVLVIPILVGFSKVKLRKRMFEYGWMCLGWIGITLSIPLITPRHIYPIYASLSLVGLLMFVGWAIGNIYSRKKIVILGLVVFWVAMSWKTLRLTEQIHWTVQEAKRVENVFTNVKDMERIPSGSKLVIKDDYQIRQALYDQLGLYYFFGDESIETYYGDYKDIAPEECAIMKKHQHECLERYNIFVLN